jgi:aminomethyltransferase
MNGYEALRQTAAWMDLSARGRIRVTGEDRKRLLHAMTTNHIEKMRPGDVVYAFFLNAQGRILADAWIYCAEDHLLLDVEPETRRKVYEHLDRYIIADDAALEDITDQTAEIAVEGPQAESAPRSGLVLAISSTGQPGYRMIVPAVEREAVIGQLRAAGIPEATAEEARVVRIENGVPRYGEDMTEAQLVHETRQLHAVHFQKGCYLGQEIVERVRARGQVHRMLYPIRIESQAPPAPGEKVFSGGEECGFVTSAAWSPAQGCVRALAYLRKLDQLSVGGAPAQLVQH